VRGVGRGQVRKSFITEIPYTIPVVVFSADSWAPVVQNIMTLMLVRIMEDENQAPEAVKKSKRI
jgi:hypothetical protein